MSPFYAERFAEVAGGGGGARRNPWLERVAHALPYLLFAAAMLLLDSMGRAATQEEFFKSVQNSVNSMGGGAGGAGGDITTRGFATVLGVVGLLVAALVLAHKISLRRGAGAWARPMGASPAGTSSRSTSRSVPRPTNINQPRKLIKEIGKAAGLSGDEMRQLKAVAEQRGHASPLTLLICPSLLIDAARREETNADRQVLARVARRVVGE